jgi:hypothetical protein
VNQDREEEAIHLVLLGLKDLQTLHVKLADEIGKRARINNLKPSKLEVSLLARIDRLRCQLRDMAEDGLKIDELSRKNTRIFMDVIETVTRKLQDIDLTLLPPSS